MVPQLAMGEIVSEREAELLIRGPPRGIGEINFFLHWLHVKMIKLNSNKYKKTDHITQPRSIKIKQQWWSL